MRFGFRLVADFATGSFKDHRVRVGWWPGRGRGAVQGSAREHTPRAGAREAPGPRLACQALPDPPAPAWRQHRWSAGNKTASRSPARAARATPGERGPLLGGDKTLSHQAGAGGSGRAGCARRGGHRGNCAVPRRVFACPALNGATAAAWPLRGLARDKLWRSPSPTSQPLRSNALFRAVPQSQRRAASGRSRSITRSDPTRPGHPPDPSGRRTVRVGRPLSSAAVQPPPWLPPNRPIP